MKKLILSAIIVLFLLSFCFAGGNVGLNEETFLLLSSSEVSPQDFSELSTADLRILRNSIFARHGYKFKSKDLRDYFGKYSWYKSEFDNVSDKLSVVEKKNVNMLSSLENGSSKVPLSGGENLFMYISKKDVAKVRKILSVNKSAVHQRCKITQKKNGCFLDYSSRNDAMPETSYEALAPWDTVVYTPLYLAVVSGSVEIVRALIDAGADVNENSNDIFECVLMEGGSYNYEACEKSPLDGTSVFEFSKDNRYSSRVPVINKWEIAKLLVEKGAKPVQHNAEYFVTAKGLPDQQTLTLMKTFVQAGLKDFPVYTSNEFGESFSVRGVPNCIVNKALDAHKPKTADFLHKNGAKKIQRTEEESGYECCVELDPTTGECPYGMPAGTIKVFYDDGSSEELKWNQVAGYCAG
ncbi:MAG: YARHG domain-containing protein [Fibrobacter sp.]|nr:YARHG domain-containing protein [Fibrobacter sp.]